jgi:hypothetical protein
MNIVGNQDIVDLVGQHYFEINRLNYRFIMNSEMSSRIQPNIEYHPAALIQLFQEGRLNLSIRNSFEYCDIHMNPYYYDIVVLDEQSYNHIYPNGRKSHLRIMFPTIQDMLNTREKIIRLITSILAS